MEIIKIYVCSPYSVFGDDKKKAREVAIKALAEANEYFNGDERYELFSPVLNNAAYRNLSYDEVMKICLKQLDSCGALFVPSAKSCDPDITQSSKGILMEMNHALLNGYRVFDPGALFGAIEI
nr:MAG TPA: Nucleoside 2-deoxyribosyltransferase [Caudoviricetes sp.]